MCRRLVVALLVLLGVAVLSDLAWAERRQAKEIDALTAAEYIDMGVRLIVVERDTVNGRPMVPGNAEPMREIARYDRGGVVKLYRGDDGQRTARIVGPSRNPVVWFASRAQADLILHDGPIPWALVQGSEGSGKTTVIPMWMFFNGILPHIGHERESGITAPTGPRLVHVKREIARYWPARWFRFSERYQKYTFYAGPSVQLVSAVQRSEEGGSPIQGANWIAHCGDELQDHFEREPDIEARGRSAPNGWYPRLNTSTFKDYPAWRTFRSACVANNHDTDPAKRAWSVTKLLGLESPFISPAHWERLRTNGTMTPREYRRRVLAEEIGPESQLYHCWKREENLRPLPTATSALHGEDVTAEVLRDWGTNIQVLVGMDPGKRQHVSVYMKAFRFSADVRRGDTRPRWFIVGETTSPDSTIEAHVQEVLARVRSQWTCNEPNKSILPGQRPRPIEGGRQILVRIDPHSKSGDNHPGRDYYSIWRSFGILTRAAAYDGELPAQIKIESRVNLVNTLLCAQSADAVTRRLFVACDDNGAPLTKNPGQPEHVVDAFESMERNEAGAAEWENKDKNDKSHWIAAIGYGLWQVELKHVHRGAM